jgi:hypothetical protein
MVATSLFTDAIGVILFRRILALERHLSDLSCGTVFLLSARYHLGDFEEGLKE